MESTVSLTRRDFKAWLEGLPPHALAGYKTSPCDCPIAKFLRFDGAINPTVGSSSYSRNGYYRSLPKWAVCVVAAIDRASFRDGICVTAGEVLEKAGRYL